MEPGFGPGAETQPDDLAPVATFAAELVSVGRTLTWNIICHILYLPFCASISKLRVQGLRSKYRCGQTPDLSGMLLINEQGLLSGKVLCPSWPPALLCLSWWLLLSLLSPSSLSLHLTCSLRLREAQLCVVKDHILLTLLQEF